MEVTREVGRALNLTVPDSFSDGQYEVEIHVTTEEGSHVKSRFRIYVYGGREDSWRNLRMSRIRFTKIRLMGRIVSIPLKWACTYIRVGIANLVPRIKKLGLGLSTYLKSKGL